MNNFYRPMASQILVSPSTVAGPILVKPSVPGLSISFKDEFVAENPSIYDVAFKTLLRFEFKACAFKQHLKCVFKRCWRFAKCPPLMRGSNCYRVFCTRFWFVHSAINSYLCSINSAFSFPIRIFTAFSKFTAFSALFNVLRMFTQKLFSGNTEFNTLFEFHTPIITHDVRERKAPDG